MVKKKIKAEWNKRASIHFEELLKHLSGQSQQAVLIVGNAILDEIEKLKAHPSHNL